MGSAAMTKRQLPEMKAGDLESVQYGTSMHYPYCRNGRCTGCLPPWPEDWKGADYGKPEVGIEGDKIVVHPGRRYRVKQEPAKDQAHLYSKGSELRVTTASEPPPGMEVGKWRHMNRKQRRAYLREHR